MSASFLGIMLATPSGVAPFAPSGITSFVSLDAASAALSGAMFITTPMPCAITPLVLMSISLTLDEKHSYLFDVNGLLEIQ
ncbi:23776_t:CDS:1, partial [Dentiscutata erythropus]